MARLVSRVIDDAPLAPAAAHNLARVAVERATAPPEQTPAGKYREVVPFNVRLTGFGPPFTERVLRPDGRFLLADFGPPDPPPPRPENVRFCDGPG